MNRFLVLLLAGILVTPAFGQPSRYPVSVDGKWGYIDSSGKIAIQPQYGFAAPFHEGLGWVVMQTNMKIPFGADALNAQEIESNGMSRDGTGYEWTLLDPLGTAVAHTARSKMKPLVVSGYTALFDGDYFRGGWGLMDTKGVVTAKGAYPSIEFVNEGLALASYDEFGPYDFVSTTGEQVTKARYKNAHSFHSGLAAVFDETAQKWGFIDTKGKFQIKPRFPFAASFSEGLARVAMDTMYGYIDKTGKLAIPYKFHDASDLHSGMARVEVGGKIGYIDASGKLVIPATIDPPPSSGFDIDYHLYDFYNGRALFRSGDKYGYIDSTGAVVIPARFDDAYTYENGLARANKDGTWGYIDKSGTFVWKAKSD